VYVQPQTGVSNCETDKDQIKQTPKSDIVLWELPHLDKGVRKTK